MSTRASDVFLLAPNVKSLPLTSHPDDSSNIEAVRRTGA